MRSQVKAKPTTPSPAEAPEDALSNAYNSLRAELESELLEEIGRAPPAFFEQLVVDLLVKMGHGGSRQDAGRAIGRSGDGGVDGIINEDRLGLDVIYMFRRSGGSPPSVARRSRSSLVRFKAIAPERGCF